MRMLGLIAGTSALLAGCGNRDESSAPVIGNDAAVPAAAAPAAAAAPKADDQAPARRWELQSSGEGTALALLSGSAPAAIRLFCPAGGNRLLVNVPGFRPIGSEERLSFGGGGDSVALVADTAGDKQRGGVSGFGAAPDNLATLVAGPISASYGAQSSGPHPAPPPALSSAFVAACREGAAPAPQPLKPGAAAAGPCLLQDGKPIRVAPVRAIGTEPFWGARVEGRCVTYSHPEDQKGTRIWTRFAPAPGGGSWSGTLGGKRFQLRIRPQPGCSDGMSDRRYPLAADLVVGGERRSGCAEPL
ncbi:MAG TPA: hypothetical protein VGA98_08730 [Allosphingosinicella sp.]|jgi:hypothetical protein